MNYIEQDTLTKDLRKLKGIMVSLSALECIFCSRGKLIPLKTVSPFPDVR